MRANLCCAVVALTSAGFFACGGSTTSGGPSTNNGAATDAGSGVDAPIAVVDAGTPTPEAAAVEAAPPVDHGAPSTTYPAFPPAMGQIADNGGYVMKNPVIVAITWNSDASQAMFDSFADAIGTSDYYKQTAGPYGVGPATSGAANHVHMATAAPATLGDPDLQTMVTTNAGITAGWPAPTKDTIYAFFLPPGASLNVGGGGPGGGGGSGDACSQGIGGYHDQVTASGIVTAYAVVPSCNFGDAPTVGDETTLSMSHEINEAVSDPEPQENSPGYVGFVPDSFAFDYFQAFQSEDGDACEFFVSGPDSSFYEQKETTPPFDYYVQRIWSNPSGAAGHNPCVPVPADAYFNVTPLGLQDVNVSLPPAVTGASTTTLQPTKGFKVAAGSSGQFQVGFYSDAATTGPWTIKASVGKGQLDSYNKSSVTASIDKTTGVNGEKAWITVNVTTSGSTFKGEMIEIVSTLGTVSHYMPVWIAGD
jgi:hypothetical protein